MLDAVLNFEQLDFLPAEYREEDFKRRSGSWRLLALACLGGSLAIAGIYQHNLSRDLSGVLAGVDKAHVVAQQQYQRLSQLQAKIGPATASAELLTYLRHPWPRTQILKAITEPLPPNVALNEIQITRVPIEKSPNAATDKVTEKPATEPQGLDKLCAENDALESVVHIAGSTRDPGTLHAYLAELSRCDLFRVVELGSISNSVAGDEGLSRFTARIVVRPGHGQPGGPADPAATAKLDSQAASKAGQP